MSKLTVIRTSDDRGIIIFTGKITDLAQSLHETAMVDKTIRNAVMTAGVAISYSEKSEAVGETMIRMINP